MWERILGDRSLGVPPTSGLLVRFYLDAAEWIPHPYAPPGCSLASFEKFSEYICPSREAFELARQWAHENSTALEERLRARLEAFPIQFGARYGFFGDADYADVAFILDSSSEPSVVIPARWKGQAALSQLVSRIFPETILEYSPPWLEGQRIDIYVPSLAVAIEYHGQQHFEAVDFFGGAAGLKATRARDRKKARACRKMGIRLVQWPHWEPVSEATLYSKLADAGVPVDID